MGKRFAAIGVAGAVALGGLGVAAIDPLGVAGAQQEPTAGAVQLEPREGPLARALDELVASGTISREQADAVVAATTQQVQEARGQRRERRAARHQELLIAVAEVLGSTPDAVRSAMRDGTSIAEQAEAAGVDRQALDDAVTALLSERIEAAVADGRIDQAQAVKASERLDAAVDRILDADGRGAGHHDGRRPDPRRPGGGSGVGGD